MDVATTSSTPMDDLMIVLFTAESNVDWIFLILAALCYYEMTTVKVQSWVTKERFDPFTSLPDELFEDHFAFKRCHHFLHNLLEC